MSPEDDVDPDEAARTSRPVLHQRTSDPKALKVVIWLVIALVIFVLVGSYVSNEYSRAFGGNHSATDWTVTTARNKGKPVAEKERDRLLTVLAPVLGSPALTALIDECGPSVLENVLSSSISCTREYVLYFPTPSEPPLASVISKVVAADAGTSPPIDRQATPGYISQSSVDYLSGWVLITSKPAIANAFLGLRQLKTVTEEEGWPELLAAASTGTNVVVTYRLIYFTG
ncbi:MAG: hypothetical protein HY829_15960 [Actinobacteria bacterium]|nr:hypothetical protein [Actinomycetota bacterium]